MKKQFLFIFSRNFVLALGLLALSTKAMAQFPCVTTPLLADASWGTAGGKILGAATIDYSPNCSSCTGATQLSATVDGANIIVSDGVTSTSITTVPAVDVILGNDTSGTGNGYFMATVSPNISGIIELDIRQITNAGASTGFTIGTATTYFISTNPGINPRIDVIAEYGNNFPSTSGLPLCNRFVVTWMDANGVEAYYATLNSPSIGSVTNIVNPGPISNDADVAAIQRKVSGVVDDVAIFTYIDATGSPVNVMYTEWDITANTMSTPAVLGIYTGNTAIGPRIDAVDDFNVNDPTAANPIAYYCIAVDDGGHDIEMYNNLSGHRNLTHGSCLSALGNSCPVTAGPDGHYSIAFGTSILPHSAVVEDVDWSTGVASTHFYKVNKGVSLENTSLANILISSSCNTEDATQKAFVFYINGSDTTIDYKSTDYPYAFKATNVQTTIEEQNWKVYPVPGSNYIQVTAPDDIKYNNLEYKLTDMMGRTIQAGTLNAGNTSLNISDLSPGVCNISVFHDGIQLYSQLIVKE